MQNSIPFSLTTSVANDWKTIATTTEKLIPHGLKLSATKTGRKQPSP
jgi:hypothetical protein